MDWILCSIFHAASLVLALKRQLNLVEICKSLAEKGLRKREAYPWWIW